MSHTSDPGPAPTPQVEPGEPEPGGVDAVIYPDGAGATTITDGADGPVARDLDPDANPAVDRALPHEMKESEDTATQATQSDEAGTTDTEDESPA